MTYYATAVLVRLLIISFVIAVFSVFFPAELITSIEQSLLFFGAYLFPLLFSYPVALYIESTISFILLFLFTYHLLRPPS